MSRSAEPVPQFTDEERFRDLFENANDVFYTLDLEGRITGLNRRAEVVLGYTREEAIGKSAADIVPPEYRPLMQEALRQKLAGGVSPIVYEIGMIRKDGNPVRLEVSSRLIVRDGVPVGVQGVARDITDRKRAEQAVLEREAELRATRNPWPRTERAWPGSRSQESPGGKGSRAAPCLSTILQARAVGRRPRPLVRATAA